MFQDASDSAAFDELSVMSKPKLPPGPEGNFFIGDVAAVKKDVLGYFEQNVRKYPGISRIRLGTYYYVNVSDPAYIEQIFLNTNKKYIKGRDNRNLTFILGEGLLTSQGEFWLKQRRLMQPLFHKQRLQGFVRKIEDCTNNLLERWKLKEAGVFDIHDEMTKLTLDVVSSALLSTTVSGDFRKVSEAISVIMRGMFGRTQSLLRLPYWMPTPKHINMKRHRKLLDDTIYKIIDDRRASAKQYNDLLTMLMEVEDADTAERMTDSQLRDEVITIYLAGHETTANALSFTFYLLAKHPEVKERISKEVEKIIDGGLDLEKVNKLEYTMRVIKESMRLYPPAWGILREAGEDDVIDGWLIKKSDSIVLAPYAVQRMEKYWEKPEKFDPDRFLPERIKDKPKYSYFPFGGGQRLCIGNNFALMEMQIVLALICPEFDFRIPDGFRLELEPTVTLRPKNGLPLIVESTVPV